MNTAIRQISSGNSSDGSSSGHVDVVDIPKDHALLGNEQNISGSPVPAVLYPDDDNLSGDVDREYTGVFEGPEKTLEVMFRQINSEGTRELDPAYTAGEKAGLRQLPRHDLDRICARARCTILSSVSNQYVDAYVLSESSLFVYPYMLVLKTCGTTTLLRCISVLIELGKKLGLEIDWVGYSRKNFNFPGDQAFPHQSFHQEMDYLYSHKSLSDRLNGNGYTLGPVTSDHWFVFVADQTVRSKSIDIDTDRVLNIMMFGIDQTIAKTFHYDDYETKDNESKEDETSRISQEMTSKAGIDALCPGAKIDPRAFEPCGYSMNAILFRSYSTMHITPEDGSSYASFETNQRVTSYKALINNVVRTFKPEHFVITLMADEGGIKVMKDLPFDGPGRMTVPCMASPKAPAKEMVYRRRELASIKVEDDCCCMMGNWVRTEEDSSPSPSTERRVRSNTVIE